MKTNDKSQIVSQKEDLIAVRRGPVGVEISAEDGGQMVVVGCAGGASGELSSIAVFAHFNSAGGLTRASIWNGRDWVVAEVKSQDAYGMSLED